ncbi:glutathione S-transferase family protein [Methylomagnum ishizawai]|uniref:glutathione S-transferase family protein n=1 Tax=Methylomagnum ishizawai TaxID=1760988 RepID=UPI001C32F710|nr:glutathione S-transferase [Methylomagnum ishizawai]BBL77260.1 glutathione S-transferase [Methylomagnum ishizawai]
MIELYEFALSGNCHKVRLMLSLLGVEYRSIPVRGTEREHKQEAFLALNPFGQVPVLVDAGLAVRDSQAILIYLARKYGGPAWWPDEAGELAAVTPWLFTAANEIARGPNAARLHRKFGIPLDYDAALAVAAEVMGIIETHLGGRAWLALDRPTLADIACYPYLALAWEGGIEPAHYPAMRDWFTRIQELPGYVAMPGM